MQKTFQQRSKCKHLCRARQAQAIAFPEFEVIKCPHLSGVYAIVGHKTNNGFEMSQLHQAFLWHAMFRSICFLPTKCSYGTWQIYSGCLALTSILPDPEILI